MQVITQDAKVHESEAQSLFRAGKRLENETPE
jgi:hypothetical protein